MDEKKKKDEKKVMLVKDASDGKLKAVTNVDKDGNIQTIDPTESNIASLLNVNTQDSVLEAFFKKMLEQADNPAHTGLSNIFIMTESVLRKLIKMDFPPEELEKYRVDPAAELQKGQQQKQDAGEESQAFQPLDLNKIDRADMERKGIRWEDMEPHLRAMSYGHKSNGLIDMNPEMEPGGVRVPTKGRVSLEEQPDGSIKVRPHYWQEKPNFDAPLYGKKLDSETKTNLELTGNAGKTIKLEITPGKKEPCYVTLDKMTNTLEVMRVADFPKRTNIKGVELSKGQQIDLYDHGKKILLEGMTTRAGYKRDAYIQINASNRNFDFSYEGLDRNRYAQANKEIRREKVASEKKEQKQAPGNSQRQSFIHKLLGGAEVPDKAYNQWKEAEADPTKQKNVRATYVKGMMLDGKDEPINLWVKPNFEKGKLEFFRWNPDYAKKQGAEVKPANESKTQHAVNTEGKTNESTKNVKEPLKQGQQKPTEGQQKKQDENKQRQAAPARKLSAPKAKKGVRI